jgi:THO complex subunit 4
MQAHYRPQSRSNSFHTPKRKLIGHQAGQAPPAWRVSDPAQGPASLQAKNKLKMQEQLGSKILLTNLPSDVGEKEVEVSTNMIFILLQN